MTSTCNTILAQLSQVFSVGMTLSGCKTVERVAGISQGEAG
jgi:hypothetical protein